MAKNTTKLKIKNTFPDFINVGKLIFLLSIFKNLIIRYDNIITNKINGAIMYLAGTPADALSAVVTEEKNHTVIPIKLVNTKNSICLFFVYLDHINEIANPEIDRIPIQLLPKISSNVCFSLL